MNLIQRQRQRDPNHSTPALLKSSNDLGWSTLFVELCSYGPREGCAPITPHAEISIMFRGSDEGVVTCRVGESAWSARPTTGSIWLKPIGGKYDEARITSPEVQVLNLYIPSAVFVSLGDHCSLPAPDRSIRYECGVQDELINQVGLSVLSEMMCPTAVGSMLVETSSLLLAARLAHAHLEAGPIRLPVESQHRLDGRRLKRVLEYVEEHLSEDMAVADLADVACLSIFHFTRAFSAATGVPPHRYVSQRRLESAKAMIASGRVSLGEAALACRFSSQSSFTRAFHRATGMTPKEYRNRFIERGRATI
jgi:AraC family transcriptional regulator